MVGFIFLMIFCTSSEETRVKELRDWGNADVGGTVRTRKRRANECNLGGEKVHKKIALFCCSAKVEGVVV